MYLSFTTPVAKRYDKIVIVCNINYVFVLIKIMLLEFLLMYGSVIIVVPNMTVIFLPGVFPMGVYVGYLVASCISLSTCRAQLQFISKKCVCPPPHIYVPASTAETEAMVRAERASTGVIVGIKGRDSERSQRHRGSHTRTYTRKHTHARARTCVHARTHTPHTHAYTMHIHAHTHTRYVHTHAQTRTYTQSHTPMHIHIHTHTRTCIHIHTPAYT